MSLFPRLFDPSEPSSLPDPCGRCIRCLTAKGKRATAERVFLRALGRLQRRFPGTDPLAVFSQAIEEAFCIHAFTDPAPARPSPSRRQGLAIRWIVAAARCRLTGPMHVRLADEIAAAYLRVEERGR
jgi:small subunit ribosomal protein S7